MVKRYTKSKNRSLESLNIKTFKHLSLQLGIREEILKNISINIEKHYKKECILVKKKERLIYKSDEKLKKIQQAINRKLLTRIKLPEAVHSYIKGKSHITSVEAHIKKNFIVKLDIKDFYPSIHYKKVYRIFINLGCSPSIASILTKLTTCQGSLVLGFPTSPTLSNLYLRDVNFDERIQNLCNQHNLTYTRYGDDLQISGTKKVQNFKKLLCEIIKQSGLIPNYIKSKPPLPSSSRQEILGIVVNQKKNISKDKYRILRAKINSFKKVPRNELLRKKILGKINYVKQLNPERGEKLLALFKKVS